MNNIWILKKEQNFPCKNFFSFNQIIINHNWNNSSPGQCAVYPSTQRGNIDVLYSTYSQSTDDRVGTKLGQIGPKWDKYGTF